ncbi:uncharacterized protein LOC135470638 [Liolophura sinensis]|uniref:uncharacterized protein LOC135470638 n=1 Tax=Liolophura sinensis TaxID=3198878 RepID=UPI0031590B2E
MSLTCLRCSRLLYSNVALSVKGTLKQRVSLKHTKVATPPNKFIDIYRDYHGHLPDEESAKDFLVAIDSKERELLLQSLLHFEEDEKHAGKVIKQQPSTVDLRRLRELLASGYPSRLCSFNFTPLVFHHYGVNLCKPHVGNFIVNSFLTAEAAPPTKDQLRLVLLHNALPFIGFGFLDNFMMIVAGEYIDTMFGAVLGISTMTAAGLGNMISDVAGVGSASYVETMAAKVGVKAPPLTPQQILLKRTRRYSNLGKMLGVSIGCFIGMFPLLFFKKDECDGNHEPGPSTPVAEQTKK